MDEGWFLSRLFIAVPELGRNIPFLERLQAAGIIGQWQLDVLKMLRGQHKVKVPTGQALLRRMAMLVPELLSAKSVDLLHLMGLVSTRDAHAMRVMFRAVGRLVPGQVSEKDILTRMGLVFDDIFSSETIAYIRALDNEQIAAMRQVFLAFPNGMKFNDWTRDGSRRILTSEDAQKIREMLAYSVRRAQILRSAVSTLRAGRITVAKAREMDNVWDAITLVFDDLLSERMLRNLIRAGVISPEREALIRSIQQLGVGVWHKVAAAVQMESWAARGLLLSEGVLSHETVKVLLELGILSPAQARVLYPTMSLIRSITRGAASTWRKSHRYRVIPGEPPIRTFARFSQDTDRAILKLLSEAANDATKEAERMMKTKAFQKMTRAQQQRLVTARLHLTMRQMWEGTGHLIIFGEKQAGVAALEAMTYLEKVYGTQGKDIQRMLRFAAQAGVDSYISREENLLPLSRRVWKNMALSSGRLDREIAKGLLRGMSPQELASVVSRFISPSVPGGSSYAAMRLARTEINNAFHFTSVRYTREMPWVEGHKWNLSGSHPRTDVCNDYAEHSEGLGRGVWGKDHTPGKPHPQCLCFITTATVDTSTWYKRYRSGAYDRYLDSVQTDGVFDEDRYTPETNRGVVRSTTTTLLLRGLADVATAAAGVLGTIVD